MDFHSKPISEVLKELSTSADVGLSSNDVLKRQKKYGLNILETKKKNSIISKFFSQFKDFMILILIAAAIISFVVSIIEGHADYIDPIIIFSIIIMNAILGVIQEEKAEKSLEALKKLSAPNSTVLRDGKIITIASKELVIGDIIFLETGQYVPADARLIKSVNLKVDEASLTGESHPVEKIANITLNSDTLPADRKNIIYSSSIVTYGRGTAVVIATGMNSEVGNIAKMILSDETPDTPLQKKLAQTGKILAISAILICIALFIIGISKGIPIFDMFMTSVSLGVAAIPDDYTKLLLFI